MVRSSPPVIVIVIVVNNPDNGDKPGRIAGTHSYWALKARLNLFEVEGCQ